MTAPSHKGRTGNLNLYQARLPAIKMNAAGNRAGRRSRNLGLYAYLAEALRLRTGWR